MRQTAPFRHGSVSGAMIALAAVLFALPLAAQQPLRVFIRAGVKTHGPGQHDYPRFLADWKKLLAEHGAVVEGAERFPTAEELAKTDVVIVYAGDAGSVKPEERAILDPYLQGGGMVVLPTACAATTRRGLRPSSAAPSSTASATGTRAR